MEWAKIRGGRGLRGLKNHLHLRSKRVRGFFVKKVFPNNFLALIAIEFTCLALKSPGVGLLLGKED